MKLIHKLSIQLILLQCFFLYFFSSASKRIYAAFNSGVYECTIRSNGKTGVQCLDNYPQYRLSDLIIQPFYFMAYGFLAGIVIIILVNWRKKKHFLNTILVVCLFLLLYFSRFFLFLQLDRTLHIIGYALSDTFSIANLIMMQIALVIALALLWLSVRRIHKQLAD